MTTSTSVSKSNIFILLAAGASAGYAPLTYQATEDLLKWELVINNRKTGILPFQEFKNFVINQCKAKNLILTESMVNFERIYGISELLASRDSAEPISHLYKYFKLPYPQFPLHNLFLADNQEYQLLLNHWKNLNINPNDLMHSMGWHIQKYFRSKCEGYSGQKISHPQIIGLLHLSEIFNLYISSLNYDILPYEATFKTSKDLNFFRGFLDKDFPTNTPHDRERNHLIQPHGAVDFAVGDNGKIYPGNQSDYLNTPKTAIFSDHNPERTLTSPLISGSGKFMNMGHSPWQELYDFTKKMISQSDHWLFMGYSLGDEHINQVIQKEFSRRLHYPSLFGPIPKVVVIDYAKQGELFEDKVIVGAATASTVNKEHYLKQRWRELLSNHNEILFDFTGIYNINWATIIKYLTK